MKKSIVAALLVALMVVASAAATTTKTSLHYAGVGCSKQKVELVCALDSQTGYLVAISSDWLIVEKWGAAKPVFVRAENGNKGSIPETASRIVGYGAGCSIDRSGPGLACALISGGHFGFEMTKNDLLVVNLDTNANVFVRTIG